MGTIYLSYVLFDSWTVAVLAMLPLGASCAVLYRRALAGWPISRLVYAFLFVAIVLSPFADAFLGGLNFMLKLAAVSWLIYHRPIKVPHVVAPDALTTSQTHS